MSRVDAVGWLAARAALTPEREALCCGGERLDFRALERGAHARAARLQADGVRPGDRVAAVIEPTVEGVLTFWAVLAAGAELAPVNTRWSPAERAQNLERLRADHQLEGPVAPLPSAEAAYVAPPPRPDATAWVLFTSGTGGTPKPALLRHRNLEASARASTARLGEVAGDRWLGCLPLFHVGGLMILVRSVIDGAGVVLLPGFDAAAVDRALDEEGVTRISLVPTTLKRLLDHRAGRPAPAALQTVLLGGAAASAALIERARRAGFPVQATYGLTEACSQVATAEATDPDPTSVGRPLPGSQIRIVDEAGGCAPVGEVGGIEVRGPTVFAGYDGDAERTDEVLRDGWLRTGDRGHLDAGGRLFVLERIGDLIVTGGENVHPSEVEAALLDHPAVDEVAVAGVPDDDLGRRVTAWVVPRRGAPDDLPERLLAHARARLAGYKVPRELRLLEALPRNAMGKVQRRDLAGPDGSA